MQSIFRKDTGYNKSIFNSPIIALPNSGLQIMGGYCTVSEKAHRFIWRSFHIFQKKMFGGEAISN